MESKEAGAAIINQKHIYPIPRVPWFIAHIVLTLLMLCAVWSVQAAEPELTAPKRVVILHSYHEGLEWTDGIDSSIRAVFQGEPVELFSEYMDSKRQPLEKVSSHDQGELAGQLTMRILRDEPSPPVITTSPNAVIVNWQALKDHDLDSTSLPDEVVVRGRPESSFWPVFLIALTIVLLAFFLSSLAGLLRSKSRVETLSRRFNAMLRHGIVLITVAMLTLAMTKTWFSYRGEVEQLREIIINKKKATIRLMVNQAIDQIAYMRTVLETFDLSEADIKKQTKHRLNNYTFADGDGYIFVLNYDGIELVNRTQPTLSGKNLLDLVDSDGTMVVRELIAAARKPEGDFVKYVWNKPSLGCEVQKISFAKGVPDWGWVIGAGLYLDDVEQLLAVERAQFRREITMRLCMILLIGLIVLVLVKGLTHWLAKHINDEVNRLKQGVRNYDVHENDLGRFYE